MRKTTVCLSLVKTSMLILQPSQGHPIQNTRYTSTYAIQYRAKSFSLQISHLSCHPLYSSTRTRLPTDVVVTIVYPMRAVAFVTFQMPVRPLFLLVLCGILLISVQSENCAHIAGPSDFSKCKTNLFLRNTDRFSGRDSTLHSVACLVRPRLRGLGVL